MRLYIGLDVHSKSTTWYGIDEAGSFRGSGAIGSDARSLVELFGRLGSGGDEVIAGMETGTTAHFVSRLLPALCTVIVIEAGEVRQLAKRRGQKSDMRDAQELADGLRRGIYTRIVPTPSAEVTLLRVLISHRRGFTKTKTQTVNRTKAALRLVGLRWKPELGTGAAWSKLMAWERIPERERGLIELQRSLWLAADAGERQIEAQLEAAIEPFAEEMERLRQIPGVDLIVGAGVIAAIGDPQRFATSARVSSYLGLVPGSNDSGERVRRGHITRQGPRLVRGFLCQAAQHARKGGHPLSALWWRICRAGGTKMANVAAARKLVCAMWRMLRDGTRWDPSLLGPGAQRRRQSEQAAA